MDPRRLEEFRRKLREGRPARVVNGEVVMLDGKPLPQQEDRQQPQQQGVLVKPHEWGSAAPCTHAPEGEARLLKEKRLLDKEYPGFQIDVEDDGTPYAHGWLGPGRTLRQAYHVLLFLPPGYGRGELPRAHVLEPRLRPGAPHLYTDGSLCLDHAGAFTRRSTLVTFLAWVTVWLCLYEGWSETGAAW